VYTTVAGPLCWQRVFAHGKLPYTPDSTQTSSQFAPAGLADTTPAVNPPNSDTTAATDAIFFRILTLAPLGR
jgi:hypothetical protein